MTIYNVHLYREMRLFYPGIVAASVEEAAKLASHRPAEEAAYTEPCDGLDLSALVDVDGDEDFQHSTLLDFEPERLRKSAAALLAAIEAVAAMPLWGERIEDPILKADYIGSAQYDPREDSFEPSCDTESSMLRDAIETARQALETYRGQA